MSNKITIIFVVNGQEQEVEANENQPLKAARNKALADSHNTGRPPDEWVIYDEQGNELDPDRKIETFHFTSPVRLTLTLRVGAGG
jgi:hypothetical protein